MTTLSGGIATAVRPLGYQARVWPSLIDISPSKKKKKKKRSPLVQLVALEWSNEKIGPDKWKVNGKEGKWRRSWNKNMFFPDDGSAPTEAGGVVTNNTTAIIQNFYGGSSGGSGSKAAKGGPAKEKIRDSAESGSWDSDSMNRLETKLKAIKAKANQGGEGISDDAIKAVDDMLAAIKAGRSGDEGAFDAFQKADESMAAEAGGEPGFFGASKGKAPKSAAPKSATKGDGDPKKDDKPKPKDKSEPKPKDKSGEDYPGAAKGSGDEDYPGAAKKAVKKKVAKKKSSKKKPKG